MIERPGDPEFAVDVVVRHPRIAELGRNSREQRRVEGFARDMARWLVGVPRSELQPLARVVTIVARRELRDTRAMCRERPLMAVEASARLTSVLWPLLRGPLEEPEEEAPEAQPEPEPDPQSGVGGGGEAEGEEDEDSEDEAGAAAATGSGEGAGDAEADGEDDDEGEDDEAAGDDGGEASGEGMDPEDVLKALGEMSEIDDPELEALIERLRERMEGPSDEVEIASDAADLLSEATNAATEGALQTDKVARYLEHFLPGVGWSSAPGQLEVSLLERLEGLTSLLEHLDELRELADQLGRLEEASRRKGPRAGGREEVAGVHLSGDVANALPSELGLLGDPSTEDLFYQRWTEHRLISLELHGSGDAGSAMGDKRGPVIACIDTSASMEGAPEMAAKALVLAVCRKVIPRGRRMHLILFGGPGERTEIRLRRGLGGLEGLLDFLALSFHSGTDFDGPLMRAMELLEENDLHAADILVVTDGLCRAGPEVVDTVNETRERRGVRVWSIVLGRRNVAGVEPFSDEVWQLDPGDAAEAVGLVQKVGTRNLHRRRGWF